MKFLRIAVIATFALVSGRAFAFHAGGVAKCEGCHTMHNSSTSTSGTASTIMNRNQPTQGNPNIGTAAQYLLQGKDPSSTCLMCHGPTDVGSYHVYGANLAGATSVTFNADNVNYTPGGDFAWLSLTSGAAGSWRRSGHNVIAADFTGLSAAAETRRSPPSGSNTASTWDGAGFSCASCHDPHGKTRWTTGGAWAKTGEPIYTSGSYGNEPETTFGAAAVGAYRLLGGNGYVAKSSPGMVAFTNNPPVAVAPKTYNQSESSYAGVRSAGQVIVAYGTGMSEWCSNCHPGMHSDINTSGSIFTHPAGSAATLSATVQGNYNSYVKSGDLTAGSDNYDALVPFEQGAAKTRADLLANASNTTYKAIAADGTSNVMCLSCHRAHASAFDFALRWADTEFVIEDGAYYGGNEANRDYSSKTGAYKTAAMLQAGMANRPASAYSAFQKSLCNKCHAKD